MFKPIGNKKTETKTDELPLPQAEDTQGDPRRINNLAVSHFYEALRLFQLAADAGNPEAQYNLGSYYRYGFGVSKDPSQAINLFNLSAQQGNEGARTSLRQIEDDAKTTEPPQESEEKKFEIPAPQNIKILINSKSYNAKIRRQAGNYIIQIPGYDEFGVKFKTTFRKGIKNVVINQTISRSFKISINNETIEIAEPWEENPTGPWPIINSIIQKDQKEVEEKRAKEELEEQKLAEELKQKKLEAAKKKKEADEEFLRKKLEEKLKREKLEAEKKKVEEALKKEEITPTASPQAPEPDLPKPKNKTLSKTQKKNLKRRLKKSQENKVDETETHVADLNNSRSSSETSSSSESNSGELDEILLELESVNPGGAPIKITSSSLKSDHKLELSPAIKPEQKKDEVNYLKLSNKPSASALKPSGNTLLTKSNAIPDLPS
jgi:hypothetical protein